MYGYGKNPLQIIGFGDFFIIILVHAKPLFYFHCGLINSIFSQSLQG